MCKAYDITLKELLKSIYGQNKLVERLMNNDIIYIGKCELPEDEAKGMEKDIQDLINEYNKKVEEKLKEKENELLTV